MKDVQHGRNANLVATFAAIAVLFAGVGSAYTDPPSWPTKFAESDQENSLSGLQESFRTTRTANMRDLPTPEGSAILLSVPQGEVLTGRLVASSLDPSVRWLQTEWNGTPGYVWTGNLTPSQ
jgi:hypothetical protein